MKNKSKISNIVFGIRIDPELKYQATLIAMKQRRSVSSFLAIAIEEAIEKANAQEEILKDANFLGDSNGN